MKIIARKFTQQEIQDIATDYKNGMSLKELAEKYDRSDCVILGKLQSLNIYQSKTNRWTIDEIELLKKYYSNLDWEELCNILPRHKKENIISKASTLKIKREQYFWNDNDIDVLINSYNHGLSTSEIAKKLNYKFSESAIVTKANKMNLKKVTKWTDDEIKILKENYSRCTFEELLELLPNHNKDSIKAKAKQINLQSVYMWKEDEKQYIINHWETTPDCIMASVLNRSQRSVKWQREQLGLFRQDKNVKHYESLAKYLRSNNTQWKKDSMESCEYKCVLTGSKDFQIHHLYGVSSILRDMVQIYNVELKENFEEYTEDELNKILELFLQIQSQYPLGECIDTNLHTLFHSLFGQQYNTPQQWEIFKREYLSNQYNYLYP